MCQNSCDVLFVAYNPSADCRFGMRWVEIKVKHILSVEFCDSINATISAVGDSFNFYNLTTAFNSCFHRHSPFLKILFEKDAKYFVASEPLNTLVALGVLTSAIISKSAIHLSDCISLLLVQGRGVYDWFIHCQNI